jgi:hypothetical protein
LRTRDHTVSHDGGERRRCNDQLLFHTDLLRSSKKCRACYTAE